MGPHTVLHMVSGDTDILAVHVDEKPREETSERISSVLGRDPAGSFQETKCHPS